MWPVRVRPHARRKQESAGAQIKDGRHLLQNGTQLTISSVTIEPNSSSQGSRMLLYVVALSCYQCGALDCVVLVILTVSKSKTSSELVEESAKSVVVPLCLELKPNHRSLDPACCGY